VRSASTRRKSCTSTASTRGHGFIASPFVQHEIYREAIYIFYGKLSVYLKALERDAGEAWAMWVGREKKRVVGLRTS